MDALATNLFLCLDQGGHASRALVFDNRGQAQAEAFHDIQTHRSGSRVEHDPEELLRSIHSAANEAIEQLGSAAVNLVAAGLATQRSSIVCWNRQTGEPLSPVLSWQDTRATAWLHDFAAHAERVHDITGLVLSPHYGVSKLRWCLDNIGAVRAAQQAGELAFGPLASFLAFRLSDARPFYADPANASRTLLWDRHTYAWSSELLELFGVPGDCLPQPVASSYDWGNLQLENYSLPLGLVTGDQSAAVFAFGQPDKQTVYLNMGTGAFAQRLVDAESTTGQLLASVVYSDEFFTTVMLEGTVNGAGAAVNKVAKDLDIDPILLKMRSATWLESFKGDAVYLNSVSGLGSPWWLPDTESRFVAREGGSIKRHDKIAAVLESVVFLLATNIEAMNEHVTQPDRALVTGGLASVDPVLQRLADLVGLPVERAISTEATARGLACLLAGVPDGWPRPQIERQFEPRHDEALLSRYEKWRALMPSFKAQ